MPIILACPKCNLRLQVPDNLAGRRVSCSGCKTVIAVPAAPPPAPAPMPMPAPMPAHAPFPPAAAPPPPANPFAFDESPAAPPRRPPRPRDEDEEEDDREDYTPARSRFRPGGRGRWAGFYGGCGLAKWGAVVELIGVAYLFLMVELAVLGALSRSVANAGIVLIVPFLLPVMIGTAMMGLGRMRMADAPPESGASAVLSLAGLSTFLRFVLLLAAAILFAVASSDRTGGKYAAYAAGAMLGGWVIGTLAEMTSVAGVAAAGAALGNRQVYSAAATSGLLHLVNGLVFTFLFLISYFAGLGDMIDEPRSASRPGLAGVVEFLVFVLQIVFTYSQYTLYAAGESAGRPGPGRA